MRSIRKEKNLNGKKILLRLDLIVPFVKGKISDTTRIDKILPTLRFLNKQKTKIIILSHIGRPKGEIVEGMSLKPISKKLSSLINKEITFNNKKIDKIELSEVTVLPITFRTQLHFR